jgi:hypothetical protein
MKPFFIGYCEVQKIGKINGIIYSLNEGVF